MSDRDTGRSLTRREFDAVIRRAAELAGSDPIGPDSALPEGEVFRIAGEVGLPDAHVRQALAEVRSGTIGGGRLDRLFGPALVAASRCCRAPTSRGAASPSATSTSRNSTPTPR